jgi:hypothetical protein
LEGEKLKERDEENVNKAIEDIFNNFKMDSYDYEIARFMFKMRELLKEFFNGKFTLNPNVFPIVIRKLIYKENGFNEDTTEEQFSKKRSKGYLEENLLSHIGSYCQSHEERCLYKTEFEQFKSLLKKFNYVAPPTRTESDEVLYGKGKDSKGPEENSSENSLENEYGEDNDTEKEGLRIMEL